MQNDIIPHGEILSTWLGKKTTKKVQSLACIRHSMGEQANAVTQEKEIRRTEMEKAYRGVCTAQISMDLCYCSSKCVSNITRLQSVK